LLFAGFALATIDAKQRLAIPAKWRNQWLEQRDGKAWFCVPWPSTGLRLYTEARFVTLAEQHEHSLTPAEEEADLDADLFGLAERLEMDGQGRIALPTAHLQLTGLGGEVVVVGARNRLEVRERASWLESQSRRFNRLPSLVARIDAKKGAK